MLKRWRTEIVAIVAAIAVGVGVALALGVGQTSESDKVAASAEAYLTAFADNDPVALCAAISPVARVQFEFSSTDCATSVKTQIQKVPEAERAKLRDAAVTVESVAGENATVKFSPKLNGRGDMHLVKRDETWFVNP
jgi:hypothetical protein